MKLRWAILFVLFFNINETLGALRRCFECRSRGDLGSCKDPFRYNATLAENVRGVETIPCATGWCAKMMEGSNSFGDSEYGVATQRMCLARGPSDNEERCANTEWNHKKVYMCFCQGDLCNSAQRTLPYFIVTLSLIFLIL